MPTLELKKISKHFGAIRALTEVDLSLESGEVLGLMGDNGAGKSTLVKIIAGNFPPSSGEILLGDTPVHFHKPVEAREKALEWFDLYPKAAYMTEIEFWRELADGRIEFTIRRLPSAD